MRFVEYKGHFGRHMKWEVEYFKDRSWRGDRGHGGGHQLWEAAVAKLCKVEFWNLYCRHFVNRTISHCFGFKIDRKGSEWRIFKVRSWRGRRGGSEVKVGNVSGFTEIRCIKANLCYPFSVVNINAPFLRHILKRMSEYCANEKAKSWRGQRGGGQNALLLNAWVGKRGKR